MILRKAGLGLFFLFIITLAYNQPINRQEVNNLAALSKVWGFLKYFHPEVSKGKFDWDTVLVMNYQRVLDVKSKQEFNVLINRIITSAGPVEPCPTCYKKEPDSLKINLNLAWMSDTSVFMPYVISRLWYIYENHYPSQNIYIKRNRKIGNAVFPGEKLYNETSLPGREYRFLALSRFWNVINYYYPYRYLIPMPWDSIYIEFIPRMINITSDYMYYRIIQELASRLNDGHGFISSHVVNIFSNRKILPFRVRTINNAEVVTNLYDTVLCREAGVMLGDTILSVDGLYAPIARKHYAQYTAASNQNYLNSQVDYWMSIVKHNPAEVVIKRAKDTIKLEVKALSGDIRKTLQHSPELPFKLLNDSVGYILMSRLRENDIDPAFQLFSKTKYLIIDSRNYPNWVIYPLSKKLLNRESVFARVTEPDFQHPGLIKWVRPMKAGYNNPDYYKGKVIVLVNSETMSRAELTVMAIKKAPNVVVIGEQTAGANGDVSILPLPGGIDVYFSGLGYYFADYSLMQKVGIRPDIVQKPTIQGIMSQKDEIFDRALQYIKTGH